MSIKFDSPTIKIINKLERELKVDQLLDNYKLLLDIANSNEASEYPDNDFIFRPNLGLIHGIDLPVVISEKSVKRKVMIIGQDPLRKTKDFQRNAAFQKGDNLIFGTPYALHSHVYRSKRTRVYWQVIKDLASGGHELYLTDIRKDFVGSVAFQKGRYKKDKELLIRDKTILEVELEEYHPDEVVCFGGLSHSFVQPICQSVLRIDPKRTEHPSPRNRNWNNLLIRDKTKDFELEKAQWIISDLGL